MRAGRKAGREAEKKGRRRREREGGGGRRERRKYAECLDEINQEAKTPEKESTMSSNSS